ncbi:DUF4249 domain-containing protein [Spirosoma utsteinense]|nr:DUF4249 domain-containing protein [Spirosoma utsteinense]
MRLAVPLFFLLGLLACTKDLGVDLPYEGDRLVVYGVLSPDSVATLRVSRTYPTTGRYQYGRWVLTAVVRLYEDSVLVEQLRHQSDGRYVSARKFKPQPGRFYHYTITNAGFPDVQSLPERVPEPIRIDRYQFDESIPAALNPGLPARKLICQFTDAKQPSDYYAMQVLGYNNSLRVAINTFGLDRPDEFEDGCGFRGWGRFDEYNLSDICFNGQTSTVRVGVELEGTIQPRGPNGKVDKVVLTLRRANRGYYEYNRTFNVNEGFLLAFQPPQVRYSNVRGGYGIILAYSKDEVTIIP